MTLEDAGLHETVASVEVNNLKVSLVYNVTWDNYCLKPRLDVVNEQTGKYSEIPTSELHGYEGPCGHNHPISYWIQTGDYNNDGRTDVAVRSGYATKANYTRFLYNSSVTDAAHFRHRAN